MQNRRNNVEGLAGATAPS